MGDVTEIFWNIIQKRIIVSELENVDQTKKNRMFGDFFDQVSKSTTEPT